MTVAERQITPHSGVNKKVLERLVVCVIRADGKVRSRLCDLVCGCGQKLGHRFPVVRTNVGHVLRHRHRIHGYLRVIVLTHDGRRLQTNRAVTQGSALGATSYDANVLGHCTSPPRIKKYEGGRMKAGLPLRIHPSSLLLVPALQSNVLLGCAK
jgi:hypothetical protein